MYENSYPALSLGALHTTDLDVSVFSTGNDLHTFKVICQNDNVTTRAICLKCFLEEIQLNIDFKN